MRTDKLGQRINIDNRGKLGRGCGFSRVAFGYNTFGNYSFFFGIHQKHYYYGKPYLCNMRFYRPTNPRTVGQQNWRAVHAYGVFLWQNFSSELKETYELLGGKLKLPGYNVFLSNFLKVKPRGFGAVYFGYGF